MSTNLEAIREHSMPDSAKLEIELWNPDHINSGRGFRCDRAEFVEYWNADIARDVKEHVGKAWIIRENDRLLGYITLCADAIPRRRKDANDLLKSEGIPYGTLPAVKIGRLARDMEAKGVGSMLVEWALEYIARIIAPKVGVRFVTVDALFDAEIPDRVYDVSKFYERFGFQFVRPSEKLTDKTRYRSMFLDIKGLTDALGVNVREG